MENTAEQLRDVAICEGTEVGEASEHLTVIEPPNGWRMVDLRALGAHRDLLWMLIIRDIKVRYRQTILGVAWAVIQPLTAMIMFTIIFGRFVRIPADGYPYSLFVYAGLLPWTFFAAAVTGSSNSLIGSAHLITRVYFPRIIVPLSSVGATLIDFGISTVILLVLMLYYGIGWTVNLIAAPILIVGVTFTAIGVGTLLSSLTVAYRDFRYVVPFLLQVWHYATPIVYPTSVVPDACQWLLYLNPITGLVEGFRSAFLGKPFNITALAFSFGVTSLVLLLGFAYFERMQRRLADII